MAVKAEAEVALSLIIALLKGYGRVRTLLPAVEIMVGEQIEGDEEWFYFTGR